MALICHFCKKPVEKDYEALSGCSSCAKDWMTNERVDHPVV